MTQSFYQISFKDLRKSYIDVKTFLEGEACIPVTSIKNRIENDLGCTGDDAYELLEKFVVKYKLDVTGFEFSKHFLSEAEQFGSYGALVFFISLPIWICYLFLKLITLDKIKIKEPKLHSIFFRETSDLTLGDLITWYIFQKYKLRSEVRFVLKNAT